MLSKEEKRKEWEKDYYLKNKERFKARAKKYQEEGRYKDYYLKNKEKVKANTKKWILKNPIKVKINAKKYREKNKEKISAKQKIWGAAHKEEIKARNKNFREKNKESYLKSRREWKKRNRPFINKTVTEDRILLKDYILNSIIKKRGDDPKLYTPEMREIVREQILIHREIKTQLEL